jgi:hypothetical protein
MNKKNEDYPDVDRIGESAMELPEQQGANVPAQLGPRTLESLRASLQIVGDITVPFKEWETT